MGWITVPILLGTLAWTALSFFAYSDWVLAFKSSLPVWLVYAAVWALTRFGSAALLKRRKAPEKARAAQRNRLAVVGAGAAVSLAFFVLVVWGAKQLEREPSGSNVVSVARNSASVGKENRSLQTAEKPKKGRSAETTSQPKQEGWSVQVGAFKSKQEAVKVATTLKGKGYEAYVMRSEDNAVNVYRAKVGRFTTREEAERLLKVLKDKEALSTAFVGKL
jgi:cell division septation protein DedD